MRRPCPDGSPSGRDHAAGPASWARVASAPPTDKEYNVRRAFEAGWGGVVWKTLGLDPHVVNVNGPRYGAIWGADRRLLGLNNIELITDRPLQVNLDEIVSVKRDYPDRAVVVSLMVPCEEEPWKFILPQVEATGADGVEPEPSAEASGKAIKRGNPLDTDTMVGAQASEQQFDKILSYMEIAQQEGAQILTGGAAEKLEGGLASGYYIQPTLIKGDNKMRVFQ